jgi:phosphoglycerate dehydrogenase-like enzyme
LEVKLASTDEVLAQADFLSLHAPSIPSTRHMINRESLAQMKDGAFLFNLARGPLVDGDALLDALDSGKLAGAGLDVFDPEPPPVDSRLRNHPKLVATPHSATTTVEARERIEAMAVEEILRFFAGKEPHNPLNPEVLARTAT